MRRVRLIIIICLISIIFLVGLSFGDGTVSIKSDSIFIHYHLARRILTLSYLGDAENGTVPNTAIDVAMYGITGWFLYSVETVPGSPAPSSDYDIVINDLDEFDIAGGLLQDLSASQGELVNIGTSAHKFPLIRSNLLVVLDNQEAPSAKGTLILIFIPNLGDGLID